MDVAESIEHVTGILTRAGLQYEVSGDGRTCRLQFESASVFVDFNTWQDDQVVITVQSPVVQDVASDSPGAAQVLNMLNGLNRSFFFVKFIFRDGMLIARSDLLGQGMPPAALLNALYEVAGAANRLREELGDLAG